MLNNRTMLPLAMAALLALPACTSMQKVEVQLRDAETHLALPDGHFSGEQTALVHGYWPPDIGLPWYNVLLPEGEYSHSRISVEIAQWYDMHVTVQAEGYGKNSFDFSVTSESKEGAGGNWKRAKLTTKDGRAIEFQVVQSPTVAEDNSTK